MYIGSLIKKPMKMDLLSNRRSLSHPSAQLVAHSVWTDKNNANVIQLVTHSSSTDCSSLLRIIHDV